MTVRFRFPEGLEMFFFSTGSMRLSGPIRQIFSAYRGLLSGSIVTGSWSRRISPNWCVCKSTLTSTSSPLYTSSWHGAYLSLGTSVHKWKWRKLVRNTTHIDWPDWVREWQPRALDTRDWRRIVQLKSFPSLWLRFGFINSVSGDPVLGNNNPTFFKVSWLGALHKRKFPNLS